MLPGGTADFCEQIVHRRVGQVSVATLDALLERPGALEIGLQKIDAMIGFDREDIGVADVFLDVCGDVAKISQPDDLAARAEEIAVMPVNNGKSDGILRIVRHRERGDFEIAKSESGTGFKELP